MLAGQPELLATNDFPKALELIVVQQGEQSCELRLEVVGGLSAHDLPLDFSYRARALRAVLLDREAIRRAYKNDLIRHEYHACDIDYPVSRIEIEVVLPSGYDATPFAAVCSSRSEVMLDSELKRILAVPDALVKKTIDGRVTATLNVQQPLLNHRYLVYWKAP